MSTKRPYENIHDWMERTGTNQTALAKMVRIRRSMLCKILSRQRRCSLENALKLAGISGVSVEKLFAPRSRDVDAQSTTAA